MPHAHSRPLFISHRSRRSVFALAEVVQGLGKKPDAVEMRFSEAPNIKVQSLYGERYGVPVDAWPNGTVVSYIGTRLAQTSEDMMAALLRKHKECGHQFGVLCTWSEDSMPYTGSWEGVFDSAGVTPDDFIYFCVTEADNPWHALNLGFSDEHTASEWSRELRGKANLSAEEAGYDSFAGPIGRCVVDPLGCRQPGMLNHMVSLLMARTPPLQDAKIKSWLEELSK